MATFHFGIFSLKKHEKQNIHDRRADARRDENWRRGEVS
jgi:hypothetical protein